MYKFLKLFLMAILTSHLVGCVESSPDPQPASIPVQQQSQEGGITSGGGGLLPSNPIHHTDVYDILKQAHTELRLFLNSMSTLNPKYADMNSVERFYYQEQNLSWALENTDLEYYNDKPCYDELGLPVDGSFLKSKPNVICISGFTTATKLTEEIAKKEIYALVIHELAHRIGANESEARELQQTAFVRLSEFLRYVGASSTYMNTKIQFEHPLFRNNSMIISLFKKNFNNMSVGDKLRVVDDMINNNTQDMEKNTGPLYNGSLNFKTYDLRNVLERGLFLFKGALLVEQGSYDEFKDGPAWYVYNRTFENADQLSVFEVGKIYGQSYLTESMFAKNLYFVKVKSVNDYKLYLDIFEKGYGYLRSYGDSVIDQNTIPELTDNLFLEKNPWIGAIGKYKLTQQSCDLKNDKFSDLTAIEVIKNAIGDVDLKFNRPNSTMEYGNIGHSEGEFVSNIGNDYVLNLTRGSRWPSESISINYQLTQEIKLSGNQMFVTSKRFEFSPAPLQSEIINTCIYDVVKE